MGSPLSLPVSRGGVHAYVATYARKTKAACELALLDLDIWYRPPPLLPPPNKHIITQGPTPLPTRRKRRRSMRAAAASTRRPSPSTPTTTTPPPQPQPQPQ